MGINFEGKCWLGTVLIFNFFGHWAKTFRLDSNMFLPRKSKTHSIDAEDQFWGTHFQKKVYSTLFWSLRRKLSNARRIFFGRNCQNCILRFQRSNVGVCFFWEKYQLLFFWVLSEKLCNLTKQYSIGLWKLHFFIFRGTFSMRKVFL